MAHRHAGRLPEPVSSSSPEKKDLKTLLTRMIPCCLLTAFGASCAGILVPLPGAVSVPLSFAIISFISSHLFGVQSTLWYSISVPVYLALAGTVLLSGFDLFHFFIPVDWFLGYSPLAVCGSGLAGALLGHWLFLMSAQ